ncbi:MAG: hypothetical protein PHQ87_10915 [Hydrogenophaga sp.]|uniref:hypothetical protein n=1 Tax=Hydrogenophaga sp. TaxID=1904254 RepID=UPI0026170ADB|nr:hypothetical protein [Hydrogenophaga sp.]MDD3786047.1 hypothetical protein [Hydrogenophaga sp.]
MMTTAHNAKPTGRRRYRPDLWADARYHKKQLEAVVAKAIKGYQEQHEKELGKLRILKAPVDVRVKSPGSPQMLKALILRILTNEGARATQTWIRKSVEQQFPQQAVYKASTAVLLSSRSHSA